MAISDNFVKYWYIIFPLIFAASTLHVCVEAFARVQIFMDKLLLKAPYSAT